jgi:phosphatidylserine/phosphatidylglycerophosphate/cardiolipin synthase-like enzyme
VAFDEWIDEATSADLDALAQCLLDGRIPERFSAGSIQIAGFNDGAVRFLERFRGVDPKAVAWMLQRLAKERREADDRYAGLARLVWSGAAEDDGAIRDTRVVLDDLFRRAERHVLLSTYVIYDGTTVFRALAERARSVPGLAIDFYVNLPSKTGLDDDEAKDVSEFLDTFTRFHWPADVPMPAIYFDPETRKVGSERWSLHAKCVVVDERWAFVTSANFTEAAQERNIEAGVLLDHPGIAEALAGRFRALREAGKLRRMARSAQ